MSHTSFLGIPVEGDIRGSERRVTQLPLTDLAPLIRAVLDDPFIDSVGWEQYTPYFNDGAPCVFSTNELWFRSVNDVVDDDHDTYEYAISSSHPSLGGRKHSWVGREIVYGPYVGEHEALYNACGALGRAIETGGFDDVLLEAFGDHAIVTMRATGITVETYDHD